MADEQPIVIVTPTGVSQYPWISKPDVKWVQFDEETGAGDFKTNLILSEADAKPLIQTINKVFKKNLQDVAETTGKQPNTANPPYEPEFDDGQKATGNTILKFKSKYQPKIFDAAGKQMTNSNIWGGSEIKVKAELKPWYSPQLGAGVKLQLMGVQVIKYVDGADVSVDDFGFKAEEGYVQHTEPTAAEEGFEENPPAALNADALPQSDLAVEQPTLKDSGKPVIEKPADVDDIVKKWSVKN